MRLLFAGAVLVTMLGCQGVGRIPLGGEGVKDPAEETEWSQDPTTRKSEPEKGARPHLEAVHDTEVRVGETIYFLGKDFMGGEEGVTELVFEGEYSYLDNQSGQEVTEQTTFSIRPKYDGYLVSEELIDGLELEPGTDVLRWPRFGPFKEPFSADGNHVGVFEGIIRTRNIYLDGHVDEDADPPFVAITVLPSIIIHRLEPFVGFDDDGLPILSECGAPALRAIGGLPYVLEVEAIGFEPDFFNYELSGMNGSDVQYPVKYGRSAKGVKDQLGMPGPGGSSPLVFNIVPEEWQFFIAGIRVFAVGSGGDFIETALPVPVVRAFEFRMLDSGFEPAQFYEPMPVSGCVPGALDNHLAYTEAWTESRQNAVTINVSKKWLNEQAADADESDWLPGISVMSALVSGDNDWTFSEAETMQENYGFSHTLSPEHSLTFSTTNGQEWGWTANEAITSSQLKGYMGELFGSLMKELAVLVGSQFSIPKAIDVVGLPEQADYEETMPGDFGPPGTYGPVVSVSGKQGVSGAYVLASYADIGLTNVWLPVSPEAVVYTFGQGSGEGPVSVGSEEAWDATWVSSETDQSLKGYSFKIPLGRYGVIYRQTVRYVSTGFLYSHNLCGVRELMGSVDFNEWAWTPALALGDECGQGELPVSSLPPAECIIPPCSSTGP